MDKNEGQSQVKSPPSASLSDSEGSDYECTLDSEDDLDPEVWEKYCQEIKESEGFDIVNFPRPSIWTRIVPLTDIHKAQITYEAVVKLARLAITSYNTQHEEAYEFVDLEKANSEVVAGAIYYITFRVKNLKAGNGNGDGDDIPLETFQARVWRGIEETQVELCRPKPIKPQN